ncbi:MAG: site-specific integrase [Spirosomataceae bacterium]
MNPTSPARTKTRAGLLSIRFVLTDSKRPETSLQCKIGINDDYATEFVIERNIKTVNWAQKLQKMLDDSPESKLLNERLTFIKLEIKRAELLLRLEGKTITAKAVKTAYMEAQGHQKVEPVQAPPKRPTFQECFRAFYDKKSTQKRKPVSDRTRESYWRYKNNLEKYLTFLRLKRLYADQITHEWAEKYLDWLIDNRGFTNDYANNNIQLLKSVLQMAEDTDFITRNPLRGFKLHDEDNYSTIHLTMTEVERMATIDFSALPIHPDTAQSLREEADCFVFTCFSAQHHSDLQRRDFELYIHPQDGRTWIRDRRVKTGTPYTLPLHPIALGIIEKYGGIDKLPVKAASNRNDRLKQIAAFCGINVKLTTKIGRKTFANYAVNTQRMRFETVAAILGHKSTKHVKHYARITEESIAAEYRF